MQDLEFSRWLLRHNIADEFIFRNVGAVAWLEQGILIRNQFSQLVSRTFEDAGFAQVSLPNLIPSSIYTLQKQHFQGLAPLSFDVHDVQHHHYAYLRTTSETPMSLLFKARKAMRGKPIRLFQIGTVFRNEAVDQLAGLLRSREINPFIESYSLLSSQQACHDEMQREIAIYRQILDQLLIPYTVNRRPRFDTFPEARYTIAFDTVLPDGKCYQVATVHDLGQAFAKAFHLSVKGGFAFQTSTGISSRAIACALMHHRSLTEVLLPTAITPQVVCLLVNSAKVHKRAQSLLETEFPGRVCVIETKARNVDHQTKSVRRGGCIISIQERRNSYRVASRYDEAEAADLRDLYSHVKNAVRGHDERLRAQAKIRVGTVRRVEEAFVADQRTGMFEIPNCGDEKCFQRLRRLLKRKGVVLGLGLDSHQPNPSPCVACSIPTPNLVRFWIGNMDHH